MILFLKFFEYQYIPVILFGRKNKISAKGWVDSEKKVTLASCSIIFLTEMNEMYFETRVRNVEIYLFLHVYVYAKYMLIIAVCFLFSPGCFLITEIPNLHTLAINSKTI